MKTQSFKKITFTENDQEVSYIGQLLSHDQDLVTFNTHFGEMTFYLSDIIVSPSNEDEFNKNVPVKEQEEIVEQKQTVNTNGVKKTDIALQIYKSMMINGEHPARKDVIERFINEVGLSKAGASTYQHNIKTKLSQQ